MKRKNVIANMRGITVLLFTFLAGTGIISTHSIGPLSGVVLSAQDSSCTRASNLLKTACQNETLDDFWREMAVCTNLSDPAARQKCEVAAADARIESDELCQEQLDARLEVCKSVGEAPYDPKIDPANFVDPRQIGRTIAPNPYFPLTRGLTWTYKRGSDETNTIVVTGATKKIQGVTCAVVTDVVKSKGEVIQDTKDWYAQDVQGNVWYFGEITQKREDGELVGIEGSWIAGVNGGKAGIIMPVQPRVGQAYRQEFAPGIVEDIGQVLSVTGSAIVPVASCNGNCLVTRDYTPIEPGNEGNKYYARGIGLILEVFPETGEREELTFFQANPFDISLQDDVTGDTLLFNSITGDYLFTRCAPGGITLSGRGVVERQGCEIELEAGSRVEAKVDSCPINPANRGSAIIRPSPIGVRFFIQDSNTLNNSSPCA